MFEYEKIFDLSQKPSFHSPLISFSVGAMNVTWTIFVTRGLCFCVINWFSASMCSSVEMIEHEMQQFLHLQLKGHININDFYMLLVSTYVLLQQNDHTCIFIVTLLILTTIHKKYNAFSQNFNSMYYVLQIVSFYDLIHLWFL